MGGIFLLSIRQYESLLRLGILLVRLLRPIWDMFVQHWVPHAPILQHTLRDDGDVATFAY